MNFAALHVLGGFLLSYSIVGKNKGFGANYKKGVIRESENVTRYKEIIQ